MSIAAVSTIDNKLSPARPAVMPMVEISVLAVAIAIAVVSYFIITGGHSPQQTLTPLLAASLLIANLLPGIALLVLIGRRVAMRRAARSPIGGKGRLHVQLVALFSVVAAVPTLLVVLFASLLFQYGVEFWFSDRARAMVENASFIAEESYRQEIDRVNREAVTMSGDISGYLQSTPIDSRDFLKAFAYQTLHRELSEAIIVHQAPDGHINSLVLLNPYERDLEKVITPAMIQQIKNGRESVMVESARAPGALTRLAYGRDNYLYVTRVFDTGTVRMIERGKVIVSDYKALLNRARAIQLRFNAALLALSLLIVGIAVWIALQVADRLVRPVNDLVAAARRVESGDLTARAAPPMAQDEVGTLANAFNAMTGRLQEQTNALVSANEQLDSRRAFMETVLSGVSAGVISVDTDGRVRLINASAKAMLATEDADAVGQPVSVIAPELAALLEGERREAVVQITAAGEPRTLAVKIARVDAGPILTFDDITQQLIDQRRAAWSDVARRIAHEIKNPLTPIQLAAERLQRRYAKQVASDDGTFARLTETIVRQVTDLRRIVDEFSSFARMPKPVFREESLADICRQTLFLHEVAHPNIRFSLDYDEPAPHLVCDRRQIGQALTNIVKNAAEAIDAHGEDARGEIAMHIATAGSGACTITVSDTGIGLPLERDRIVEPYMTTRSRGTGLGLAIVKKIVEEHFGTITFADRPGGGTVVTLCFDGNMLASLAQAAPEDGDTAAADRLAALTPIRNG